MRPFDTIQYKGCTVELHQDDDAQSPREDDNVGEILYTSSRYNLGDRRTTSEEIREITERNDVVFLPVYAYIHSGTALNTTGFSCPWDSGQCGIIWCTKERAIAEWGKKRFTKHVEEKCKNYLRGEVATLSAYFEGEVFGYIAKDMDDEEIDSCWGFYPDEDFKKRHDYAISEAKSSIDHFLSKRAQQADQHMALIG